MLKSVNYTPNGYSNYPIAQTLCPQVFRGGGVNLSSNSSGTSGLTQADYVSNPAFRGQSQPTAQILQTPPDTVEISAENKIKTKKKDGLSTGAKLALGAIGTAAAIYAGVVGHRYLNKPTIETVQKNFSEIFRRDVSKEEAGKMAEEYKKLFKIKDKDEFAQKVFEQVKKDFGMEQLNIKIEKLSEEQIATASDAGLHLGGGYKPLGCSVSKAENNLTQIDFNEFAVRYNPSDNKNEIFKIIVHELTHNKQYEMAYRYDKDKFLKAVIDKMCGDNTKLKDCISGEYTELFNKIYSKEWDKLPKISKGTKDAELAEKYLYEIEHYIDGNTNFDKYMAQTLENEAHGTADKVKTVYNYFANPWHIF